MKRLDAVLHYHERTKHRLSSPAASLGYLDWETQPDPFRRYEGAPLRPLPLPTEADATAYESLFRVGAVAPRPLSILALSEFFYYSLALSAWKRSGENLWSLRVNPSSGNLHPTEGYLAIGGLDGLRSEPGVYHYAPREHGLEARAEIEAEPWRALTRGLPADAFLVGLSSIHWRESWKYGERAYRYCQHDIGHALAALRLAAARLGWGLRVLEDIGDDQIAALFGLDRAGEFLPQERDVPGLLAAVFPSGPVPREDLRGAVRPDSALVAITQGKWLGKARRLSPAHQAWEIIDGVARACIKEQSGPEPRVDGRRTGARIADPTPAPPCAAERIIRQRRSAVAMDGKTSLSKEAFYAMMRRLLPDRDSVPWDVCDAPARIHLAVFVHRVEGLAAGLYMLVRESDRREWLQSQTAPGFLWREPVDAPAGLPLYLLQEGDMRGLAMQVSCTQEIAGDGAFSLGMLAEFEPFLSRCGASCYRNIFWETGMIGQVLYLDAEAWGVRGTGIGCFFDDAMHEALGIRGRGLQSLYHFTVGGPLSDDRLMTLPAYPPRT